MKKRIDLKKKPLFTVEVLVTFIDGSDQFTETFEGMSLKDCLHKAYTNWDGHTVQYLSGSPI